MGVIDVQGVQVEVEQGPKWLAELLYSPPWWAAPLVLLVLILVAAAAYGVYRRHGVDEEVRREMAGNLIVVSSIALATVALSSTGMFGYWVDVSGGVALGFGLAVAVQEWVGL